MAPILILLKPRSSPLHGSIVALILLCFACSPALAANVPPVEAELIRNLDLQSIKQGDDILLKIDKSWTDGKCSVAQASVLHAKVLEAGYSPGSKRERIALQPAYPCAEPLGKQLFVFALLAPAEDTVAFQLREFHSPSFGQGGGLGSAGNSQGNHVDLSGRQNPSLPVVYGQDDSQASRRPASLHAGDTWKLNKVSLKLGEGPEHSTAIESRSGHLRLLKGTVLVLTEDEPRSHKSESPIETSARPLPTAARAEVPRTVPALSACRPPACSAIGPLASSSSDPRPIATLSLKGLEYNRSKHMEMVESGYDAAIAYLDENHLLFTFNARVLVHRPAGFHSEIRPRSVKAVVINLVTQRREETVTWEVPDHNQYLWPLPGARVLVHSGNDLQILDRGLKTLQTLPLTQPLIYLRVSPNGRHFAVGTLSEMHSAEEHQQLVETTKVLPEEHVHVALYDDQFRRLDEVVESSRSTRPVLLNDGYVQERMARSGEFYLRFQDYDRKSYRDFARMKSECVPAISSFSNDLLFAETCDPQKLMENVEIFRADGTPVSRASVDWRTLSPTSIGTEQQPAFVLSALHVAGDFVRGSVFHANEVESEAISVLSAKDGHRLLQVNVSTPDPAQQIVALSPSGARLAVLAGEKIEVYDVPLTAPIPQ